MKFPRNAKIFRGRLEAGPFAAVFFLLVIFLLLATLIYTPGVRLDLPLADDLPGTDRPTVSVAVDARGRYYFENQLVEEPKLRSSLQEAVRASSEPLTLVVQADKGVTYEMLIHVTLLARDVGIRDALLATLPRPLSRRSAASVP